MERQRKESRRGSQLPSTDEDHEVQSAHSDETHTAGAEKRLAKILAASVCVCLGKEDTEWKAGVDVYC
jgi:hypothetical protein